MKPSIVECLAKSSGGMSRDEIERSQLGSFASIDMLIEILEENGLIESCMLVGGKWGYRITSHGQSTLSRVQDA